MWLVGIGLAIRKIWRTMCVSINGPGDLIFDHLTLKLVCVMHLRWETSKFGHARPLGSRIIRYVCDGGTDRQADRRRTDKSNAYCPLLYGREINN